MKSPNGALVQQEDLGGPGLEGHSCSLGGFSSNLGAAVLVVVKAIGLMEVKPKTRSGWIPATKLGHLVKDMRIKSLEICLFSLPIQESKITDFFLGKSLKDEV